MKDKKNLMNNVNVIFLLTNIPCPRIKKKIQHAVAFSAVKVIYWDRFFIQFPVSYPDNVDVMSIKTKNTHSVFWGRILPFSLFSLRAMRSLSLFANINIIHVDFVDVLILARIYKTFINRSVKIYYEVGDLSNYQLSDFNIFNIMFQLLEKRLLNKVAVLIISSPFFWDIYYKKIYSGKYMVIENMPKLSALGDFIPRKMNREFTVGFIGSIRYSEMLRKLIRIVDELHQEGNKIRVFIAGSGPDYDHFFKLSKIKSFIEFYGPFDYEKHIKKLYEKIDLTFAVYDLRIENVRFALPNRLYESIACKVPIMVAKGTSLCNIVEKHDVGFCVNYDSGDEYRKILLEILNKGERFFKVKENLKRLNREEFFYDKYKPQLDYLYKDIKL